MPSILPEVVSYQANHSPRYLLNPRIESDKNHLDHHGRETPKVLKQPFSSNPLLESMYTLDKFFCLDKPTKYKWARKVLSEMKWKKAKKFVDPPNSS